LVGLAGKPEPTSQQTNRIRTGIFFYSFDFVLASGLSAAAACFFIKNDL
jgi:hypothetical protein